MQNSEILIAVVLDEAQLTLEQLAELCAVEPEWILSHIDDGLLPALRHESGEWRFSRAKLTRAKRILTIERTFDAAPELAALVADMQEELESLRRQLQRAGAR